MFESNQGKLESIQSCQIKRLGWHDRQKQWIDSKHLWMKNELNQENIESI